MRLDGAYYSAVCCTTIFYSPVFAQSSTARTYSPVHTSCTTRRPGHPARFRGNGHGAGELQPNALGMNPRDHHTETLGPLKKAEEDHHTIGLEGERWMSRRCLHMQMRPRLRYIRPDIFLHVRLRSRHIVLCSRHTVLAVYTFYMLYYLQYLSTVPTCLLTSYRIYLLAYIQLQYGEQVT